ncbi:hypothetical protein PG995_014344 [Apiospora arundinis]
MPFLPDLPLELVGLIGQGIDEADLLALRLVCRDLAAKTLDQVVARFFTVIRIFVTRDDLQLLRDVSRHPVFRRSIRTLWIIPSPFKNRVELDFEDFLEDCRYSSLNFDDPMDEEVYRAYKGSMEEFLELVTTDILYNTLRECIGSLPSLKRVLMQQEEGMMRGWKKLCSSVGENPDNGLVKSIRQGDTTPLCATVFVTLLKALAVAKPAGTVGSEYSIDTLDACGERDDGIHGDIKPVSLGTNVEGSPCASGACVSVPRKFRCQHMNIALSSAWHFHDIANIFRDNPLLHALAEIFSELQTLSLKYVDTSRKGFSPLSQAVRFTCLESLVLSDLQTTAGDLIGFLRTAAPTLRRLRIQGTALELPQGGLPGWEAFIDFEKMKTAWLELFQFLKSSMKDLQSLHLGINAEYGMRLKNPLRGQIEEDVYTLGPPLDYYDATVDEIGLAEWLDQLGFEKYDPFFRLRPRGAALDAYCALPLLTDFVALHPQRQQQPNTD